MQPRPRRSWKLSSFYDNRPTRSCRASWPHCLCQQHCKPGFPPGTSAMSRVLDAGLICSPHSFISHQQCRMTRSDCVRFIIFALDVCASTMTGEATQIKRTSVQRLWDVYRGFGFNFLTIRLLYLHKQVRFASSCLTFTQCRWRCHIFDPRHFAMCKLATRCH